MAKGIYLGIDSLSRKVKKMYLGIEGVARKVKKGYVGVNGLARLFFSGVGPPRFREQLTPVSSYSGEIKHCTSNDQYVIFYVGTRTPRGAVCFNSELVSTEPNWPDYSPALVGSAQSSGDEIGATFGEYANATGYRQIGKFNYVKEFLASDDLSLLQANTNIEFETTPGWSGLNIVGAVVNDQYLVKNWCHNMDGYGAHTWYLDKALTSQEISPTYYQTENVAVSTKKHAFWGYGVRQGNVDSATNDIIAYDDDLVRVQLHENAAAPEDLRRNRGGAKAGEGEEYALFAGGYTNSSSERYSSAVSAISEDLTISQIGNLSEARALSRGISLAGGFSFFTPGSTSNYKPLYCDVFDPDLTHSVLDNPKDPPQEGVMTWAKPLENLAIGDGYSLGSGLFVYEQ